MDKSKNRTDLLAAGRKKLQQFRQKKDGKGIKSSAKTRKYEHDEDADASSTATKPAELRSHPDMGVADSLASYSLRNSVAADIDVATVDRFSGPVLPEAGTVETTAVESPLEDPGYNESKLDTSVDRGPYVDASSPYEGGSTHAIDSEDARAASPETLETLVSEEISANDGTSVPVDFSASSNVVDLSEAAAISPEMEGVDEEEQEADGSGLKQVDKNSVSEPEGDKGLSLSELDKNAEAHAEAVPGNEGVESNDVVVYDVDKLVVSDEGLPDRDNLSALKSGLTFEQRDVVLDSFSDEKSDLPSFSGDYGSFVKNFQVDMQEKIAVVDGSVIPRDNDSSSQSKMVSLPSRTDVGLICLSQFAEVLQGLEEDDFRFLLTLRKFPTAEPRNTGALNAAKCDICGSWERLQEQFYITSCEKAIFHLHLSEQLELQTDLNCQCQQLVGELSMANTSLNEVRGKNESLVEDLALCRSELDTAAHESEEVRMQFSIAKAEAVEFSARIDELQIKLERSVGELSSLSIELVDCRVSMAALHVQNEKLHGCLNSLTEERKKLVDEKENIVFENEQVAVALVECKASLASLWLENVNLSEHLASLTEKTRKLEEEKESFVSEEDRLLTDLAECKSMAEALQVENADINGILASVMEDRKNLEEEKEHFLHETQKIWMGLMGCKGLVEALLLEIANLRGSFASVTEGKNSLEEEKCIVSENDKQLAGLAGCKGLLAGLQMECRKAVDDLKEATLCLQQLTEENLHLRSSLELYKSEQSEIDNRGVKFSSQEAISGNQLEVFNEASMSRESVTGNYDSHQVPGNRETENFSPVLVEPSSVSPAEKPTLEQLKLDVYDDSLGLIILKRHLDEAEKIMQKLQNAIEGMHSHSVSLARSSGKVGAPGVSKLIQAFETKIHTDDHDLKEMPSTDDRSDADPYVMSKEQTENLRVLLKELSLDAENSSKLIRAERNSKRLADFRSNQLKIHKEALEVHSSNVEEANIGLVVLYEVVRQHACNIETKNCDLVILYEALWQQENTLKGVNSELGIKLSVFQERITELQSQLDDIQRNSDEMVSSVNSQVKALHKETSESALTLEKEWNSLVSQLVQSVGKLDTTVDTCCSALPTGIHDGVDVGRHIAASVDVAVKVIEDLHAKLKFACKDHEAICSSYSEMNEKFNNLQGKNQLAVGMLHKIYRDLRKLSNSSYNSTEESGTDAHDEILLHLPDLSDYDNLMKQLEQIRGERLQLEYVNNELNSELMDRRKHIDELNKGYLGSDAICKLIEVVESVVNLEGIETNIDEPASCLESLISFLLQKFRKADEKVSLFGELLGTKEAELSELQSQIDFLTFLILQYEIGILIFRESLMSSMDGHVSAHSALQEKVAELDQSKQRVSSFREKLSMAVTRGKGLIGQRDHLRQSLAEMSSELEKCSHELQLKDALVNELEIKLKTYSEAGERMEALESELSYIRNSATALRESFLLKDSVLQRIEEILEDIELPENFHSRGIIEKVDWLARSVTGNSLQPTDWDQRSSVGGGSYSDAGFVVMDAWKEDAQLNSNSGDELRRKYEELQNKFFRLAEQNEMLEQSLVERNNLVQRWEEILDRIDMPPQFRSMEPEDRIEWLGAAISEAQNHCDSLQKTIDNSESFCRSLAADLESSQKRVSDVEADLLSVVSEKGHLSKRLENLTHDYDEVSEEAAQFGVMNDNLQNEATALQHKLNEKLVAEDRMQHVESQVRRLQDLLIDVLQDPVTEDFGSDCDSTVYLEQLLRKLIGKYTALSVSRPVALDAVEYFVEKTDVTHNVMRIRDSEDVEGRDVAVVGKKLGVVLGELVLVKEERDALIKNNQSLVHEVETADMKGQHLQELLNQEHQKSASLREKLNVAARKVKSLVQQRDSMKQAIEEVNSEVDRLKSKIRLQEIALSDYEQKIRNLSPYQERVETIESESLFLRNRLAETEHYLQEHGHNLSRILNTLGNFDIGFELNLSDPVEKLEQLGKLYCDLHATVASSENELKKSKRAAELLLAELNEVQERNDALQEDLAKATSELSELAKERNLAEAAKGELLAHLNKLSAVRSEEREKQFAGFMALKSGVDRLGEGLFAIDHLLEDVLSKDLEILHDLEVCVKSCLQPVDGPNVAGLPIGVTPGNITCSNSESKEDVLSTDSLSDSKMLEYFRDNLFTELYSFVGRHLEGLTTETRVIKERLHKHSHSFHEEATCISEVVGTVHREMTSQKQSLESMKTDIIRLESAEKEKHKEIHVVHGNLSMLYGACARSVMEIENWKSQVVGNGLTIGVLGINSESSTLIDGGNHFSGLALLSSEDSVRTMANKLLAVVKGFISMQTEVAEVGQKEMESTISNLQRELQKKDAQNERICLDLVNQIKEAEAAAKGYLQDLQVVRAQVLNLEKQLSLMEEDRFTMEQRVKELEDQEASSIDLEERVKSLTDALASKEQEIEALMQALDEEETQIEDLGNKIGKLEKVLLQKNLDLEDLEASRGKAMKKLSITMSKFDEIHHLSAVLLSEVEKLRLQIQDRDAEISFLRQEVTRCTNDALVASRISNNRNSNAMHDLMMWLDTMVPRSEVHDVQLDNMKSMSVDECKRILQKQITSILSELEDLREVAQNSDRFLQIERSRVEELTRKGELLECSLHEKESELVMLRGVGDSGQAASSTSEIMEVEPLINKELIPGTSIAPQVRSLRKTNTDQIAIAIDTDLGIGGSLEDEDDDKAHGFKSLTTSRVVPRFTRPVTDIIDGLWVSCDRALMRQPALRLGVIIYWAVLHALLATFIV